MTMPRLDEKAIFNGARQLGSDEARWEYIGQACGEDSNLRARVESLLRVFEEDQSFLESPAEVLQAAFDEPIAEAPGTVIGPYKLLEQIGEGGFGVVFLAEQQHPVRRKVALKVIKPGMDTRQVIARFEAERQALALMDHANIAHVLDGGETASGRPYFVMELVRGVPVTEYCDQNHLPVSQRLELFLTICQAVQHAHQKGIIHRDLKPSNALVTLHDGTPVVKVIDFGIAKATGQKLTEKTLLTNFAHMVGTPLYMSPEQAEMSGLDIDTRTDIYALGVLLYELLTGAAPFDRERLRTVAFDELRRIIREEEPAKPSARISTLGVAAATVTANRQTDPERLRRLLGGELDWIVMKCLEKDRTRRYATANGLARDIQRYLRDEPVEAGPPSAVYKLRKFLVRNKKPVVTAALVLLALVGGIAGTTWGLLRAENARRDVQKRLAQVEKATEILASVFRDLDPQGAEKEAATLHDLLGLRLGEAARQLEGEAVGDPLVVARLQHALGVSLRELSYLRQAEEVLAKTCQTREQLLGADDLLTAATKQDLAMLYRTYGKYAQAERLYKEVLAVRTAQLGNHHRDTLATQHHLAILYYSQGNFAVAETLHEEVLAARTAELGAQDPDTLASQHWLGLLYRSQSKDAEAEALYNEVLAVRKAQLGAENLATIDIKEELAELYRDNRKYAEAEKLLKEVLAVRTLKLGAYHLETLDTRYHLAVLYQSQGKFDLAEAIHKEVLALRTAKLGADHPVTLRSQHHLAALYGDQGRYALAETTYKEMLALRTAKLGADHPDTLNTMVNLARLYSSLRKFDLSIPLFDETLKLKEAKFGPDSFTTIGAQANLGVDYRDAGRFNDAIPLLEEVYQKSGKYPELAWVGDTLLGVYVQAGKVTEAIAFATERARAARKRLPADSPPLAAALATACEALVDVKAYADAEPLLRECLLIRQKEEADAWTTFHTQSLLGAALLGQKKNSEAETNLIQGYQGMKDREAQMPFHERVRLAKNLERLVHLYEAWGKKAEADKWRKELEERQAKPKS
jgi:serine/threonine protein kinase/tetratricopeptide (TPR) repeat protein